MNFVVLTAALSSANANFYLVSRTLFSLARGGYVPAALGSVDARGTPRNALLLSSAGLAVAVVVRWFWPDSAYAWFLGVALFGALLVWSLIFVVHVRFRREWDRPGAPPLPFRSPLGRAAPWWGASLVFAILVSRGGRRGSARRSSPPFRGWPSSSWVIVSPGRRRPESRCHSIRPSRSTSPTTCSTPASARGAASGPPSTAASAGSPTARSRRWPTASATSCARLGVEPEQRVIVALPDGPEFVGALFGTLKIGAVVVMVNPQLKAEDVAYFFEYTRARVAVVAAGTLDAFGGRGPRGAVAETPARRGRAGGRPRVLREGRGLGAGHARQRGDAPRRRRRSGSSPAGPRAGPRRWCRRTSPSRTPPSSTPKGRWVTRETDVTLSVPKLFFGYATGSNLFFPFSVGAHVRALPRAPARRTSSSRRSGGTGRPC